MIISPGRRFIFVHIPKTGGTAMATALEDRAMKDDILIGDTPKAKRRKGRLKDVRTAGRLWKHSTLADVDGLVTSQQTRDWFVFTLVRNPWDRMVSYYHWLRVQTFNHPATDLAKSVSFSDFILHDQTCATLSANPSRHYVTSAAGQICADAFIRLEHLEGDLAPLKAHLGFDLTLPRINASDRPVGYRALYSDAAAAAVARCCADDIKRFEYQY